MTKRRIRGSYPDFDCEDFAARLRMARCNLGLTQEQAAAAAGVTTKTWRAYETIGRGRITGALLNFKNHYPLNLDQLFPLVGGGTIMPDERRPALRLVWCNPDFAK